MHMTMTWTPQFAPNKTLADFEHPILAQNAAEPQTL